MKSRSPIVAKCFGFGGLSFGEAWSCSSKSVRRWQLHHPW